MILKEEQIIRGTLEAIWDVATDVDCWPTWDPHEESAKLHGPFVEGTKGDSKPRGGPVAHWVLTKVEPIKHWSLINKMPFGTLQVENRYEALPDNKVRCEKTMIVSGPLVILFWLHFAKVTRADMHATWEALEREVAKRA